MSWLQGATPATAITLNRITKRCEIQDCCTAHLEQMGIEPGRIKLVWASAAEGMILAHEIEVFVEEVRQLGPLELAKMG